METRVCPHSLLSCNKEGAGGPAAAPGAQLGGPCGAVGLPAVSPSCRRGSGAAGASVWLKHFLPGTVQSPLCAAEEGGWDFPAEPAWGRSGWEGNSEAFLRVFAGLCGRAGFLLVALLMICCAAQGALSRALHAALLLRSLPRGWMRCSPSRVGTIPYRVLNNKPRASWLLYFRPVGDFADRLALGEQIGRAHV